MRRLVQVIPIFCTVLILGIGGFMPHLTAQFSDRGLENEAVLLKNQEFTFALEREGDFFQTLKLFGDAHSQVELENGYCLKAEDAIAAAVEARTQFAAAPNAYANPKVTPMLLSSKTVPGLSGVFWRCIWQESDDTSKEGDVAADSSMILWLDDQSGQMVAFAGEVDRHDQLDTTVVRKETIAVLTEYCRLSYPIDAAQIALTDENDSEGRYTVTLQKNQNGQTKACSLFLRITDGCFYFNL